MTETRLAQLRADPRVAARLTGAPISALTASTILAAYRVGLLTPAEVDAYIEPEQTPATPEPALPPAYCGAVIWYHSTEDRPDPRAAAAAWAATHPETRRNALEVVFEAYLENRSTAEAYAAFMRDSTTEGKLALLRQLETDVLPDLSGTPELWIKTREFRSALRAELGGVYGLTV